MRVLHLHAGVLYGGVETFLVTLARERALCPEMDHHFGACFESRMTEELRALDARVTMLGEARLSRPLSVRRTRHALRRLLDDRRPDVAVCHMAKPFWLFAAALQERNIRTALYLHSPVDPSGTFERLGRRRRPHLMVGVSAHTLGSGEAVYAAAQTAVISNPMPHPVSRFDGLEFERTALRAELQTPEDAVVIVQATRMDEWKGHRELLDGLAYMRETPRWIMWVVGGPQSRRETAYYEDLKQHARHRGVADRIRFVGQRNDVPRLLAASDIYCQANTDSEGFSVSFTEALSAGLPVVTTDVGSAREIISPSVGILTPVADPFELATALGSLVRDDARRAAMGAEARRWIVRVSDTGRQIRRLHTELARIA
jgi:glycosyltransferase involved in cell wall biosynthesis